MSSLFFFKLIFFFKFSIFRRIDVVLVYISAFIFSIFVLHLLRLAPFLCRTLQLWYFYFFILSISSCLALCVLLPSSSRPRGSGSPKESSSLRISTVQILIQKWCVCEAVVTISAERLPSRSSPDKQSLGSRKRSDGSLRCFRSRFNLCFHRAPLKSVRQSS